MINQSPSPTQALAGHFARRAPQAPAQALPQQGAAPMPQAPAPMSAPPAAAGSPFNGLFSKMQAMRGPAPQGQAGPSLPPMGTPFAGGGAAMQAMQRAPQGGSLPPWMQSVMQTSNGGIGAGAFGSNGRPFGGEAPAPPTQGQGPMQMPPQPSDPQALMNWQMKLKESLGAPQAPEGAPVFGGGATPGGPQLMQLIASLRGGG